MEVSSKIVMGQRMVYKGDMANSSGRGAVVGVRANGVAGRMYSMNFGSGQLEPFDSSVSYDIALDDGRAMNGVYVSNIGGEFNNKSCRFMLAEGVADAAEVAALQAGVAMKVASDKAKQDEQAAAFNKAKAEAAAAGRKLGLTPVAEFSKRGSAAASNLRAELKAAGIKASVRQDGYSAIRVSVSTEDVQAAQQIARKYEAGSFSGMTDCYEYSPGAWGSVFGDARYVFVYGGA